MPEMTAPTQQRLDRQLLLSLMLPPLAAGISTIVGYTVAHWITITAYKRCGYLVSLVSLVACGVAALLAWNSRNRLGRPDDVAPRDGRQLFMARLALLLSVMCALVVLADTLVLLILRPGD